MEFRLLGPLEIWASGRPVRLIRKQERVLLAILLLRANQPVALTELLDQLWPQEQPADPRGALQSYISRLRQQIAAAGGPTIEYDGSSYTIRLDLDQTDLGRFLELRKAASLQEPVLRAATLRAASEIWRGPALDGLGLENLVAGLEEQRWAALEERLEAELAIGNEAGLLGELADLVERYPTREKLAGSWLLTLHRLGRRADALSGYHRLSRRLRDEYGLDPAPPLRRLHLAILRDDHRLLRATSSVRSELPRELPADVSLLVGRDKLLAQGEAVLRGERPVLALWGGAGVGKSAAATRLAHQVARDHPDGQLFARLQDVDGGPVDPGVVLGRMLRSLGLTADQIPETMEARSELFRERTAELAILLLLDDALDPGQVWPLLPAGPRCAVILTSRKPLQAAEITSRMEVTRLQEEDGYQLLTQLIGRQAGDPGAMSVILDHCAGLPLALRVVGSRLALSGSETAMDFAAALSDDERRLDWLVAGDRAVRLSMELTLSTADETAKALFERIVLVGVDEFSPWVATGLLGGDEDGAAEALDRLLDLGLFEVAAWTPFRRLRMHSIVRSYAVERHGHLSPEERHRATSRYLRTTLRLVSLADVCVPSGATVAARLPVPDAERVPQSKGGSSPIRWAGSILSGPSSALQSGWPSVTDSWTSPHGSLCGSTATW
jgi:DNA-binding SARP family transcriptional activator